MTDRPAPARLTKAGTERKRDPERTAAAILAAAVHEFSQKGYELLSLRAEWTDPSDRFTLAVFGDNVTNAKYKSQILPGPFAIQTTWGSPTTYGGSVRVKF